jgi:hypothetical protein
MSSQRFSLAIFCAAIASMQSQPLVLWAAFLWLKGLINSTNKKRDFFVLSLYMIPAIVPPVFYYINFGVFNLRAEDLLIRNASILKILDLFFDLNFGMLPYISISLFLFLGIVMRDAFFRRKMSLGVQLFILIILMMFGCSLKGDWHHGTAGPSRYVIWMLPFIFFVLSSEVKLSLHDAAKSIYSYIVWLAIITQMFTVFNGGGFIERENICFYKHTPLARFTLIHFPALYNPNSQIFMDRTAESEAYDQARPFVYYYAGKCKKALVKGKGEEELKIMCGYIPKEYINFFKDEKNKEAFQYINYY